MDWEACHQPALFLVLRNVIRRMSAVECHGQHFPAIFAVFPAILAVDPWNNTTSTPHLPEWAVGKAAHYLKLRVTSMTAV